VGGVPACPIGNTERLVSCDQLRASAKGDFSGSALFQGRYKAILFDPEECLLAIHYDIHLNPVRVGILKGVEAEEGALDKTLLRKRRERLRDPQLRKRLSAVARHLNVQC
jgi:hypothetical protein